MDIYNISNWATSTTYEVNDIVLQNNLYYYCKVRHVAGTFATDLASGNWDGNLSFNGKNYPYFFWRPSFGYRIPIKPDVNVIRFGDSYVQDRSTNISNIMLRLELQFNDRSLSEITAILHFLHARRGSGRFLFIPPAPYGITKLFVCQEFDSGQDFYEKYPLNVVFEERII